jgi:hypothetical protein
MEVIIVLLTELLNANPMHNPTNIPINTLAKLVKIPTSVNREAHNPSNGGSRNARSTKIKYAYSLHIKVW